MAASTLPVSSTADECSLPQPGPGVSCAHSLLCLNPLSLADSREKSKYSSSHHLLSTCYVPGIYLDWKACLRPSFDCACYIHPGNRDRDPRLGPPSCLGGVSGTVQPFPGNAVSLSKGCNITLQFTKICLSAVTTSGCHPSPGKRHPPPPHFQMRKLRLVPTCLQ